MKLAELLNERKTVNEEIKMVKQRLYLSAKMQGGIRDRLNLQMTSRRH